MRGSRAGACRGELDGQAAALSSTSSREYIYGLSAMLVASPPPPPVHKKCPPSPSRPSSPSSAMVQETFTSRNVSYGPLSTTRPPSPLHRQVSVEVIVRRRTPLSSSFSSFFCFHSSSLLLARSQRRLRHPGASRPWSRSSRRRDSIGPPGFRSARRPARRHRVRHHVWRVLVL